MRFPSALLLLAAVAVASAPGASAADLKLDPLTSLLQLPEDCRVKVLQDIRLAEDWGTQNGGLKAVTGDSYVAHRTRRSVARGAEVKVYDVELDKGNALIYLVGEELTFVKLGGNSAGKSLSVQSFHEVFRGLLQMRCIDTDAEFIRK